MLDSEDELFSEDELPPCTDSESDCSESSSVGGESSPGKLVEAPSKKSKPHKDQACQSSKKTREICKTKLDGYPRKTMTAYAIFCQRRKKTLSEAVANDDAPEKSAGEDGAASETQHESLKIGSKRGENILKEYKAAWTALSAEEKAEYDSLAEQDEQRFRDELQSWLSTQEDGAPGTEAAKIILEAPTKSALKRKTQRVKVDGRKRSRKLDGYPHKAMTAYGIFCQKRKNTLSEAVASEDAAEKIAGEDGAASETQQESLKIGSKRGENILKEYRAAWTALSAEDKAEYDSLAEKDEQRFRDELQSWLSTQEDGAPGTETAKIILQAPGTSGLKRKTQSVEVNVRKRSRKLEGYPEKAMTAYGMFCQRRKRRLSEVVANEDAPEKVAAGDGAVADTQQESLESAPKRGVNTLKEYRAAWNALSFEEKAEYDSLAMHDEQRFRDELESWLSKQEEGGLGTEAAKNLLLTPRRAVTRAIPPVVKRKTQSVEVDVNSMDAVLLGAAALKKPSQSEPSSSSLPALADPASASSQGFWDNSALNSTLFAQADDTDGEDLFAGFAHAQVHEPSDTNDSPMLPLPTSEGLNSFDPLPIPSGIPAAFGPSIHENDEIAHENDWIHGENDSLPEEDAGVPLAEDFALAPLQRHEDMWSDAPSRNTGGGGGGGALQLQFDAEGNTIIDPSSTQVCMDDEPAPVDMTGAVNEPVKNYESAYPRTKATKWSEDDTRRFYEALSIYGTDLFLVQTFFRDKSAAQIKTKYNKELKKFPEAVQKALTTQAQRLTKDAFEKQHGKIDTSKHYVPPPTPEPGEEPEPEIDNPIGFPEQMFPPEPASCTEDDEADTTNRLMALFD